MLEWSLPNLLAWAVQVAALAAAGVVLPKLLQVDVPGARLLLLRGLLVVCLALPWLQPWTMVPATVSPERATIERLEPGRDEGAVTSGIRPAPGVEQRGVAGVAASALSWPRVVVGAIAAGAALRLAWLGLGLLALVRLRRSSRPLARGLESVADAGLAVGAAATFLESDRVRRPVTFGLRVPIVLVPEGFGDLEPSHQLAIACHELLHVRRRDWLRALADEVVRAAFWFHPAIWWLVEQIHLSAEQLIDREVVRLIGDRRTYLQALLTLAEAGAEPRLLLAARFLDRGHLRQRVAMLKKEASMSRVRFAVSLALVLAVLVAGGAFVVHAFPLSATAPAAVVAAPRPAAFGPAAVTSASASPRALQPAPAPQGQPPVAQAPRPGMPTAPAGAPDETTLKQRIQLNPKDTSNYFQLGQLYEASKDFRRALAAYEAAVKVAPKDPEVYMQLFGYYNRRGDFENGADAMRRRTEVEPNNPTAFTTLAAWYAARATADHALSDSQKAGYVDRAIDYCDAALRIDADHPIALTAKSELLRTRAALEPDPTAKQALVAEADGLRDRVNALRPQRAAAFPADAVRVGSGIKTPVKTKSVDAVYPKIAAAARVAGVVIIEALIGADGKVQDCRVLRSIPLLDQAALEAVRQWEYEPVVIDGRAVPVVMTVTVSFQPPPAGAPAGAAAVGSEVMSWRTPPPTTSIPGQAAPVRVGGNIQAPQKLVNVPPVYPDVARNARVQGVVILEILIDEEGKVSSAKVLRSIPLLDQAALDAAKQWVFTVTKLNGTPVPVIMTVTVNFPGDV